MLVQTRVKKRKDVSAKWEEIREGHVEGMKRARFPAGAAPMRAFVNGLMSLPRSGRLGGQEGPDGEDQVAHAVDRHEEGRDGDGGVGPTDL